MGLAVLIVAMVWGRILRSGIQPYGLDGAPWIEHQARLEWLETWRARGELGVLGLLDRADGFFPPVMHIVSTPFAALGGHTDLAAAFTAVGWLLLLAAAVGIVGHRLSGDPAVAAASAAGTLLIPACHGFATRYYYDVPMTAALWVVVAGILSWWDARPVRGGLAVGLLWVLADLIKWTSLVFGAAMVVGAWATATHAGRSLPRRTAAILITSTVMGVLLWGYLQATGEEGSLRVMLDQMWGDLGERSFEGAQGLTLAGVLQSVSGFVEQQGWRFGTELPAGKWRFYPGGMVTAVLSPLLTLPVVVLTGLWAVRSRAGWPLFGATILGQWLFILGWVPVIDERFLITMAPCLVLAAALGWGTLGARARKRVAVLVALGGLWVGAEFHFGVPPLPTAPVVVFEAQNVQVPATVARGLGLQDSQEQRGWARWDTETRVGVWERERLWRGMIDCGAEVILEGPGVREDERALGAYWVGYRSILREQVEGRRDRVFSYRCRDAAVAGLAVTRHPKGQDVSPGSCLGDRPWSLYTTEPAPGSTDWLAFWTVEGAGGCTSAPTFGR